MEKHNLGNKVLKKEEKTPLLVNGVRQRTKEKSNKEKYQKGNNRQIKPQSTFQVPAAVCGTSNTARFSLLIRLVPWYPDCGLRPVFVNYAEPLGVRQYQTSRAGSSSNHATRLLGYGLSISKGRQKNEMKITESQRKKHQKRNKKRRQGKTTFEPW